MDGAVENMARMLDVNSWYGLEGAELFSKGMEFIMAKQQFTGPTPFAPPSPEETKTLMKRIAELRAAIQERQRIASSEGGTPDEACRVMQKELADLLAQSPQVMERGKEIAWLKEEIGKLQQEGAAEGKKLPAKCKTYQRRLSKLLQQGWTEG